MLMIACDPASCCDSNVMSATLNGAHPSHVQALCLLLAVKCAQGPEQQQLLWLTSSILQ